MWTKEEQENLKELLLSGVESNIMIAVEMLKQQEIPEEFEPLICYITSVEYNSTVKSALLKILPLMNSKKTDYWIQVFSLFEKQIFYPSSDSINLLLDNFDLVDSYFGLAPHYLQKVKMSGKILIHTQWNKKLGLKILERIAFYFPNDFNFNYDYAYNLPDTESELKIKYYKKSLEANPNMAAPYLRLIELYGQCAEQEKLMKLLSECLEKKIAKTEFLVSAALDLRRKGHPLLSKQMLEIILQAEPDCHLAMNNLSFLLWSDLQEHDKALEIILKAVELKPNKGLYWHSLAEVYFYGFKDKQKAINAILSGREHAPQYNDAEALLKEIQES
jgi:tetratricopeptide (TPR) repeat protein